jgi:hypothetical protein
MLCGYMILHCRYTYGTHHTMIKNLCATATLNTLRAILSTAYHNACVVCFSHSLSFLLFLSLLLSLSISLSLPPSLRSRFLYSLSARTHCLHDNVNYRNGEKWSPDKCTTCICSNGLTFCNALTCQEDIAHCGWTSIPDGECCPTCTGQ